MVINGIGDRGLLRIGLICLWVLGLALYIAAKLNFFTGYFRLGTAAYVREHSVYWVALAAIAFAVWLIEKRIPR